MKTKNLIVSIFLIAITSILINSCKKEEEEETVYSKPIVTTTTAATEITTNSAICGGNVTSEGDGSVTKRGICWSTSSNPTIQSDTLMSGVGAGYFSCKLTNLTANKTYYFKAFATSSIGTSYGTQVQFTTDQDNVGEIAYVADNDSNIYKTIVIGTQTWMKENLRTNKFNDGTSIKTTTNATDYISGETAPEYQWAYNGSESEVVSKGRLYTWFAATNTKGICPIGWHLPTNDDWKTLTDYLISVNTNSDSLAIAKAMASSSGWESSTETGAIGYSPELNNKSGFSAIAAGYRDSYGTFSLKGTHAYWWTATEYETEKAKAHNLSYSLDKDYEVNSVKKRGYSVRCVKD